MKVCAVCLTFNPSVELLAKAISALQGQVDRVILYDNASVNQQNVVKLATEKGADLLCGVKNIGVSGLNLIASEAIAAGADYILIFDQDSEMPSGYVSRAVTRCASDDVIVVPAYRDRERGAYSPVFRIGRFWLIKRPLQLDGDREYVATDLAIGSGMLVPRRVWESVNGMRASFFLDCIDLDLCFKARAANVGLFYDTRSVMEHSIGEGSLNVLSLFRISNHKPFRHYLYVRNSISLIREAYVPIGWKIYQSIKLTVQVCIYSVVGIDASENRKFFLKLIKEYLSSFRISS